jgi:AraC-like DNA-binding protein
MEIEINTLMSYFIEHPISAKDIFKYKVGVSAKSIGGETHPSYAGIVFPVKGRAIFTFRDKKYELEPGVILFAGAGMELSKEVVGNTPWEFILIHYEAKVSKEKDLLANAHFLLEIGTNNILCELLEELCQYHLRPDNRAKLKVKALFLRVLDEILATASHKKVLEKKDFIKEITNYIHEHYRENLSVSGLAEEFGIEGRQLAYLFKKNLGMSPQNYLTAYRMNKARDNLRTSKDTIIQIANQVGYTDSFYFSKLFKKYEGISPTYYREKFEKHTW